jgi:carnitine O-acetyltransferase
MPTSTTTVRTFTAPKSLNESLAQAEKPTMTPDTGRSHDGAKMVVDGFSQAEKNPFSTHDHRIQQGITYAAQDKLPKLPIPNLEGTTSKYLAALKPLQSVREHAETQQAVEEFLKAEGPELQERLKKYATGRTSYIEQFCKH